MPLTYMPRIHLDDPSWFFGRQKELQKLFSYLDKTSPQNVQIVGQRRIGKSWLLQVVAQDAARCAQYLREPQKFTFIYWDLQREIHLAPELFLQRLVELVLQHLPAALRDECQATAAQENDAGDAIWEMLDLLEAAEQHVILLLDEFAAITRNKAFTENFFSHLRAIFGRPGLTCVTASYLSLGEMCHLGPDSPFFNIFSRLQLGLFSPEEAEGFVQQPLAAQGIQIEPEAIKAILRLAGPHPCFISQLCHDLAIEARTSKRITKEAVEGCSVDFQAEVFDDYRYYWQRLEAEEQAMLSQIVAGDPPRSLDNKVYLSLERLGLVRREKNKVIPLSEPFTQFVRETRSTDIYFEKAFSDPGFGGASYMLMAENQLNAAVHIPEAMRKDLRAAIQAMQGRPQEAMRTCGRDVLTPLLELVYQIEFHQRLSGKQIDTCKEFDAKAETKQFPRHLAAHFHLLRISGNDGSHAEEYTEACTTGRAFLTVLESIHLAEEIYKRYGK